MTVKMVKRNNQVKQSIEWYLESLEILLKEKPFSSIKITDLSQKSGLSKRTFYRHFSDITALLELKIENLVISLYSDLQEIHLETFEDVIYHFFVFAQNNYEFLHILYRDNLIYLFQQSLNNHISKSQLGKLDFSFPQNVYSFAIGGMTNLLVEWLKNNGQQSPNEMKIIGLEITSHLSKN